MMTRTPLRTAGCFFLLLLGIRSAPAGITHRWSFAETNGPVMDSIAAANGTVAVLGGNSTRMNGQVRLGGGARGTSDYVLLPGGLVRNLTNVSIEVWATPNQAQNWSRVFDFGPGNDTQANNFFLSFCRGTSLNQQRLEYGAPSVWFLDTGLATTVSNKFHYVVAWSATGGTSGGGLALWYRNGVVISGIDTGVSKISNVNDTVLWLGRSQYPGDATATADYDEVRIYDHALSQTQISTNFLNGPNTLVFVPPVAANDAMTLNPGAMALISVLQNDQALGAPIDPTTVSIVNPPAAGTAQVKSSGVILYTHNGGPATADQFGYRVKDTAGSTSQVATVLITITNKFRLAAPTLTMPAAPPTVGYQIVNAFPGLTFEDALAIHTPPGVTNQIFVVERRGRISYVPDINATTPARLVFLDVVNQMSFDDTVEGERGLLSIAFHPSFATNGYFFVFYTAPGAPYFDRLARFTADPVALTVDTNTQIRLFDVVDEQFNHNGGDLHFSNDGYLYIGTGDEGNQYNAQLNSQRIDKDLYSALLRIDVDKKPGNPEPRPSANTTTIYTNALGKAFYSIPTNNPFVNATTYLGSPINTNTLRAEIFATGFRHIWRFSIDQPTGDIWVGDVGQDSYEEVNVVTNGGNYGWAYYEALTPALSLYPSQTTLLSNPPTNFVNSPPVWFYPHTGLPGDAQYKGNSISGGVVYRGAKIPALTGAYIVADFVSANIWSLFRTNNTVLTNRIAGQAGVAGFGLDPGNGDVLLANYAFNQIQRLVRVDTAGSTFPAKLSDTGAFADLTTLAPNPGLVNYEPIVSFWSDYAVKRRWFALPDLVNTITHAANTNWTLPNGMVWVKHFDLELTRGNPATKKRLETRFLVRNTNGVYGVSYAWNAAGDEAFLVPDGGTNFNLTITEGANTITQQWTIPSRTECLACHVPAAGHALSFNTRELNQTATMNGVTANQLATLSAAGYFSNPVTAPQTLPAFAAATNTSVSLESRVRSYLAVNCVQCHQPAGAGPGTWDARPWLTLDETALINGTPYNNGANPANKLVILGDLAHSVLLQRIRGNGFGRMPPLATSIIDQAATNLLTAWIGGDLTNRLTFAQWQLAYFGSTNAANAQATADPDGDGASNYYEYLTQTPPTNAVPSPWGIGIAKNGTNANILFPRLANRGFVVETSETPGNWSPWNVPGNVLWFSASNFSDAVTGPLTLNTNRFFRVKIYEP